MPEKKQSLVDAIGEQSTDKDTSLLAAPPPVQPILTLSGAQCTSLSKESNLVFLFDDKEETYWESTLGTGPDECISLSFIGEGALVKSIQLVPFTSDEHVPIGKYDVFINSVHYKTSETPIIPIDTLVKRLDVCFQPLLDLNFNRFEVEAYNVTVGRFPQKKRIGLKSLEILNAEGLSCKIQLPQKVKGRLVPSSNLNPLVNYHAGFLFDGKKEHAWVEGSEGSGSGDSIFFQMEEPVCINKITIWNGNQATMDDYYANARIKSFKFSPVGDTNQILFQLTDLPLPSDIFVSADTTSSWKLNIVDIYPGSLTRDLAISELIFYNCADQPFIITSGLMEQFQNEMLSQVEESILEQYLNQYIYNDVQSEIENTFSRKSITLHQNGQFSAKVQDEQHQIKNHFQVEGYWYVIELNEQIVRLQLSGRRLTFDKNPPDSKFEAELVTKPGGIIEVSGLLGKFYTE